MSLDKKDVELIERIVFKNGDDVAVSISRSFERIEERIDAAESRINARVADAEDKRGRVDRLNFGGVHRVGARHDTTHLTMKITGYDAKKGRINDANGFLGLVSDSGDLAAAWAFSGILEHWSRKHAKAVYVPSQCRTEPVRQYCYGGKVRLAERTDSLRLLRALAQGAVYYDPGIKLEGVSTVKPTSKRRSQFRVASKNIAALYESVETVEV